MHQCQVGIIGQRCIKAQQRIEIGFCQCSKDHLQPFNPFRVTRRGVMAKAIGMGEKCCCHGQRLIKVRGGGKSLGVLKVQFCHQGQVVAARRPDPVCRVTQIKAVQRQPGRG